MVMVEHEVSLLLLVFELILEKILNIVRHNTNLNYIIISEIMLEFIFSNFRAPFAFRTGAPNF